MIRIVLLLALVLSCTMAGTASAATVTLRVEPQESGDPRVEILHFPDGPERDVANDLRVESSGRALVFTDHGASVRAGPGCEQVVPSAVRCVLPPARLRGLSLIINLGGVLAEPDGLSDRADLSGIVADDLSTNVQTGARRTEIVGSAGSDTLFGSDGADLLKGDAGDDALDGGAGNDELHGGAGADELEAGTGLDRLFGGAGDDRLMQEDGAKSAPVDADALDGGTGSDTVSYEERSEPVTVTLGDDSPDGSPGEGDRLASIEGLDGGSGADRLVGDEHANLLSGGEGADSLVGRGGADILIANAEETPRSRNTVECGRGRDLVAGSSAPDRLARDCERVTFLGDGFLTAFEPFLAARSQPEPSVTPTPRVLSGGRAISVAVTCTRARHYGHCRGTVAAFASRRRAKGSPAGSSRFSIRAGRTGRVTVPLSRRGRIAIARRQPIVMRLRVLRRLGGGRRIFTVRTAGVWSSRPSR